MTCEGVAMVFCKVFRPIISACCRIRMALLAKKLASRGITRINLGCGTQLIPGYLGIDAGSSAELTLDLSYGVLPFVPESLDAVICVSAINYFTRQRAAELVKETYRVLKVGGVARFSVQDMEALAKKYVEKDESFFFQKLSDGRERLEGPTMGDKFAAWFYGYMTAGGACRYFYDYDSLAYLFRQADFRLVERKEYQKSRLERIELIDNRPDQMFFLEAVK